jgi:hypothetical protein
MQACLLSLCCSHFLLSGRRFWGFCVGLLINLASILRRKNHKIRVVDMATRQVSDFSGSGDQASLSPTATPDGPRDTCSFDFPLAMALDKRLRRLLVSDLIGLRQIDLQTGATRTLIPWTGHYHGLKLLPRPWAVIAMNDFADGPVEVASLGSRTSLADMEIGSDRRAPIVEMHFSHDGRTLFFVNSRRDFVRSMYVSGPAGVEVRNSYFKNNMARLGAGIDIYGAQSQVAVIGSAFSGAMPFLWFVLFGILTLANAVSSFSYMIVAVNLWLMSSELHIEVMQ